MVAPSKPLNFTGSINFAKGTTEYSWTDSDTETKYQLREILSGTTPTPTPTLIRHESNSGSVTFTGTWSDLSSASHSGGHTKSSSTANSTAEYIFTGTGVKWISLTASSQGIADVYIDNVKMATVDNYSYSTFTKTVRYEKTDLIYGEHKIKIVVTGTKNANSSGTVIQVDAFDIMGIQDPIVLDNIPANSTSIPYSTVELPYNTNDPEITRYLLAINGDGTSEPSDVVTLYPPPFAPSGFQITYTKSTSVDCSWTDNSNNETGFKIYNRVGSQFSESDTLLKTVTTSPTTVTGLTEGQTYNLYVVSYNDTGNSTASNVVTTTPSANLSRNFTLNYDILSPIQKSIDFNYDIRNQVNRELEIVYNLNKESVENSLSIKYDIYGNEQFKLGMYKLGQKILSEAINTSFFDLVETITLTKDPQGAVFNLTEGIVIYRSSTRNLTEYLSAIYKSSLYDLTENLTIRTFSEYDLSESILIKCENNHNLTETLSIVFTGSQDLQENINIYYDGKLNLTEDIIVRGQGNFDLIETININLNEGFNLTETINIYKLGLRNLDETLTIIAQRNYNLTETANVVYGGKRDLTETINIVSYHFNLPETLTIKSLEIQGIALYLDAQHTQLVDNNIDSFIYDFGTLNEEEKIVTFYLLNNKPINLTNLWVKVEIDGLKNKYGQSMSFVSNNAIDWSDKPILVASSIPSKGSSQFSVKIKPLLGIDNDSNIGVKFSLYTR